MSLSLKNKKILVTGATGFIGANITHSLVEKGSRISILTRKAADKWRIQNILKDVTDYSADLLDDERLQKTVQRIKPEIILHTATYGGYAFQNDRSKTFATNLAGTINLLNACRKTGFDLFVNTGSSSEYGIKAGPMKETDILEPITDYGVSKAAATLYCQSAARRQKLPITTLRLFSPYGYFDGPSRMVSSTILSCLRRKNPKVVSPLSVRDFIFIDDIVDAYIKTIKYAKRASGEIFNIGSGKQYSVKEAVSAILNITDCKLEAVSDKRFNLRIEPKSWRADIRKSAAILGWKPRFELSEGLQKTVEWFTDNINLYTRS